MNKFELEVEKMKERVRNYFNSSEEYKNLTIDYVLVDTKEIQNSVVGVFSGGSTIDSMIFLNEELLEINPYTLKIDEIPEWCYSPDNDILSYLEKNKEIGYMNIETHTEIWEYVKDVGVEDIEYSKGFQKYLKYCKENQITKERIEKANNLEDGVVEDIMKYYKDEKYKKGKGIER